MRIVIAPDKFKGTLSALEAANAIARGAREAAPGVDVMTSPVADGGEGTGSVLLAALGGTAQRRRVSGPLGDHVDGEVVRLSDGTLIIEMASASGLHLVATGRRDALRASSVGTGELVSFALDHAPDAAKIVVAVGGSASTDGGTGAASAVGWSFTDAGGRPLGPGGAPLRDLARIVPPDRRGAGEVTIAGACDVDAPLLGESGAARLFATQKGASDAEVEILEEALGKLAERIRADLHVDVVSAHGAGAGGGMGAGLLAFFGASLTSGFDLVATRTRLGDVLSEADLVITGEGRLDRSSLIGKSAVGVAGMCATIGVPCVALAGEVALEDEEVARVGFARAVALADLYGRDAALAHADDVLRRAARTLVTSILG